MTDRLSFATSGKLPFAVTVRHSTFNVVLFRDVEMGALACDALSRKSRPDWLAARNRLMSRRQDSGPVIRRASPSTSHRLLLFPQWKASSVLLFFTAMFIVKEQSRNNFRIQLGTVSGPAGLFVTYTDLVATANEFVIRVCGAFGPISLVKFFVAMTPAKVEKNTRLSEGNS